MDILGILWIPNWLLLIIILLITYCVYMCKDYGVFKSMGIPGPTPLPILGNMWPYFTVGVKNTQDKQYKKYGRIWGIYEMNAPNLFIGDPEIIREILVKQFNNFPNRRIPVQQAPPLDKMMTVLVDGHWKHVRAMTSPTFSSGRIKNMTALINLACDKLVANLMKQAENKEDIEIKLACKPFAMDAIASVAFGIQIDSQDNPDTPFVKYAKTFFSMRWWLLLLMMFCPSLLPYAMRLPTETKTATAFFKDVVDKTINQRKADAEKRNDFLQLMINANALAESSTEKSEQDTEIGKLDGEIQRKGLTTDEIVAQAIIFFLAGFENNASVLAMALYCLALHPDALEKTLEELDRVVGKDGEITYEKVSELHYLEQVIHESERLYPAGFRIDRVCSATTTIKGITIPKGMIVSIPISSIHRDGEFWPNPEKFDPDRFRPEVKGDINPFTFMPFGQGPRNCIAMRLAQVQMRIAAARVLQKLKPFKVSRTQENPEFSKLGFLTINGGSWIGLEKRE